MTSTFFGIEIARRGLQAHRRSMDTTGHNIANANTPGYSRQEAVHTASHPHSVPSLNRQMNPGQLGSGVSVDFIRRIRNEYLDNQYRDNAATEGFWQAKLDVAQQTELIFPEPSGRGVQSVMLNFFNDWHELNNNPQDAGVKAAVRESGLELASIFRQTHSQLNHVRNNIAHLDDANNVTGGRLGDQLDQLNDLVKEITELNTSINKIIAVGSQPNDLMDRRDLLLDQLSNFGELTVTDQLGGMVTVKLFGVELITDDNQQQTVTAVLDDGRFELSIGGSTVSLDGWNTGYLAGLQKSITDVSGYIDSLNQLAEVLIEKVNEAHETDFFSGDSAADIDLIQTDLSLIDGDQALAVAQLRSTPLINDGTLEGFYQGLVAEVGAKTRTAMNQLTNHQAIGSQIVSLRESVAGVSLDEELSRMIQFQYGFQASARMMAALDDMLDVIINRLF